MRFDFKRRIQDLKDFSQGAGLNVEDLGTGVNIISPDLIRNGLAVQDLSYVANLIGHKPAWPRVSYVGHSLVRPVEPLRLMPLINSSSGWPPVRRACEYR